MWSYFHPLRDHLKVKSPHPIKLAHCSTQTPNISPVATHPKLTPAPPFPIPDLLVPVKDVWGDAFNPSYLSKTSSETFEKKGGLFGEGGVRVWV